MSPSGVNVYFGVGIPEGNSFIQEGILFEPKLTAISPNVGTVGGTLITATVHGVGTNTQDIDLVNGAGKSICQTVKIVAYS